MPSSSHRTLHTNLFGLVEVGTPHVHRHDLDDFRGLQSAQVGGDGRLVPLLQHADDGSLGEVGQHQPGLAEQMNLVNAHPLRGHEGRRLVQPTDVPVEQVADGLLVHPNLVGHGHECPADALLAHPPHQPLGHLPPVVHVGEWLEERLAASLAAVAGAGQLDDDSLPVGGQVGQLLRPCAVPVQIVGQRLAVMTPVRFLVVGRMDVVGVALILHRRNRPVGEVQDVHGLRPSEQFFCRRLDPSAAMLVQLVRFSDQSRHLIDTTSTPPECVPPTLVIHPPPVPRLARVNSRPSRNQLGDRRLTCRLLLGLDGDQEGEDLPAQMRRRLPRQGLPGERHLLQGVAGRGREPAVNAVTVTDDFGELGRLDANGNVAVVRGAADHPPLHLRHRPRTDDRLVRSGGGVPLHPHGRLTLIPGVAGLTLHEPTPPPRPVEPATGGTAVGVPVQVASPGLAESAARPAVLDSHVSAAAVSSRHGKLRPILGNHASETVDSVCDDLSSHGFLR